LYGEANDLIVRPFGEALPTIDLLRGVLADAVSAENQFARFPHTLRLECASRTFG
jgi:hypothetical protein